MRNRYSTLHDAFSFARLGAEAWTVIGLRMSKIACGGPAAMFECHRMVAEKSAAMVEAQMAAAAMLATGGNHGRAGRAAMTVYRRKVRANRRRLTLKP